MQHNSGSPTHRRLCSGWDIQSSLRLQCVIHNLWEKGMQISWEWLMSRAWKAEGLQEKMLDLTLNGIRYTLLSLNMMAHGGSMLRFSDRKCIFLCNLIWINTGWCSFSTVFFSADSFTYHCCNVVLCVRFHPLPSQTSLQGAPTTGLSSFRLNWNICKLLQHHRHLLEPLELDNSGLEQMLLLRDVHWNYFLSNK